LSLISSSQWLVHVTAFSWSSLYKVQDFMFMRVEGEWGNSLHTIRNVVDHQSKLYMWGVGGSALRTHTHPPSTQQYIGLKTMMWWDEDFTHFDRIDKASLLDSNAWYNQFKENLNKNWMIVVMTNYKTHDIVGWIYTYIFFKCIKTWNGHSLAHSFQCNKGQNLISKLRSRLVINLGYIYYIQHNFAAIL
jgi:hypothetical protein